MISASTLITTDNNIIMKLTSTALLYLQVYFCGNEGQKRNRSTVYMHTTQVTYNQMFHNVSRPTHRNCECNFTQNSAATAHMTKLHAHSKCAGPLTPKSHHNVQLIHAQLAPINIHIYIYHVQKSSQPTAVQIEHILQNISSSKT